MPELLFWAHDYSGEIADPKQLAALPHPFDLIDWHPDGWVWGIEELTDPRWRIVAWADADPNICDSLLGTEMPTYDTLRNEVTMLQYRQRFVNLSDPSFAGGLPDVLSWWNDATRAVPIYTVPVGFAIDVASVVVTRQPLAD